MLQYNKDLKNYYITIGGIDVLDNKDLEYVKEQLSFWDKLNDTDKHIIENTISKITYKKGYNIHNAENECLGMLLILSGELRVYILSDDGREITLYRLTAGDTCVLSASCILSNITFDVHIDAESDTELFLLNINAFSRICSENVYAENFALKNAVDRFSDVMWAMEQILFMSIDKRIAIFLLDEMAKTNSSEINLTHEQISKYIGSAREVVSRMLKIFQADGILELSRGAIHVINRDKLKELV